MDRIHRLGQFKPIRVVRFVIQDTIEDRILRLQEKKRLDTIEDRILRLQEKKRLDTIEDRILRLQEKKRLVFESTVGGSNDALARLTAADMQFLFT
ncbi:hypothetical protein T484DRAFT_1855838 [Baffinella frigidus]|nr:hypothetical protein T484DRAFT_1855838 [Cryptophyta sp. CCMP2293]